MDELDYSSLSIQELLTRIAAKTPAPGGGAVTAMATSMAAALCAMAARYSTEQMLDASDLADQAEDLSRNVAGLAQRDAEAYGRVLAALAMPREPDPEQRRRAVRSALSDAADVPLAIAEAAASVTRMGAELATKGNPNLRGDAITATLLADAAARAAGSLVAINLAREPDDTRLARVRDCTARTGAAASEITSSTAGTGSTASTGSA
ncbi:MAG: cyclodeaminase/cyclohydrolase family protein [Acidimicrobiales bacterium]